MAKIDGVDFRMFSAMPERGLMPSFEKHFLDQIRGQLIDQVDARIKEYLVNNLRRLGFLFENEASLKNFITDRITTVGFEDQPDYYAWYLDYESEDEMGKLIGSFWKTMDLSFDGGKVMATFGDNPK